MEGRLRYLNDKTDLATVAVTAREQKNYQPPMALSFTQRIASAWAGSVDRVANFLQNFAVFVVAHFLGFVLFVSIALVCWLIVRPCIMWLWRIAQA